MSPPATANPYGRGISPPDEAWLAKAAPEPVLDPELPIVDAHHHLWQRRDHRYLLDDLLADLNSGHNIAETVFLQCGAMYRGTGPAEMRPVGETEFVAGIAAMSDSGNYGSMRVAAGIIGFADLTLGDRVVPVLEAHLRAGGGRFRGVRHSGNWDADPVIGNAGLDTQPGLYARADFRAGLRRLCDLGLVFDAWVFHTQLADVVDLARAFPDLTMILGHTGGPLGYGSYAGRRDVVFADWRTGMTEVAQCDNVVVKLGGLMRRLAAFDYQAVPAPPSSETLAGYWRPWIETAIELFGARRCLFESNFPVEKVGVGYRALWNAFKRIAADASPDEKAALFAGTARRAYRLA